VDATIVIIFQGRPLVLARVDLSEKTEVGGYSLE
jgi:hypothetical protein